MEGSLIERTHFVHAFFILNYEWYIFHFTNVQNFTTWGRNYKIRPQACFFNRGLRPPSIILGRHNILHVIKWTKPSSFVFCILQMIKNWTVGRPGNEAK